MDGGGIDMSGEASLQEALRQIDDWDTDFAALFGLEDVTPSSKRQRRSRRPSAKQERLDLRQQLGDLQSEAAALRATRVSTHDADALWNEIAARQREQRVSAEVENSKLRRVLDSEREAARRFALLAGKVATIGTALGSSTEARVDRYSGPQVDLHAHLERLDGLCREAQTVFTSGRFAENAGRDFRDVDFQNHGREGLLIELAVSWVLPFAVERVVEALWFQTTRMPRMERTTSFKDIYAAERTLVSQFVSEANTLGTIHADHLQPVGWSAHGQIATRYEVAKPDGSVLLVSDMDVKNFQQDGTCRSFMQGNGFLFVEPLKTVGASAQSACRVNWCRRVQGRAPDGSINGMTEYAKFAHSMTTRAMREKWWSSIELHLQAIENSLFDAAHGDERLTNASCAPMCLGAAPRPLPS